MHTKINKHPIDPNFLTHVLWSTTNLGMQHIQLELPRILSYSLTKKIKHMSRINTFVNYTIMINSPEVYFGIPRPHAEVGHKNITSFSYKNHICRFCINEKQFI
jgi:hypothetical protein